MDMAGLRRDSAADGVGGPPGSVVNDAPPLLLRPILNNLGELGVPTPCKSPEPEEDEGLTGCSAEEVAVGTPHSLAVHTFRTIGQKKLNLVLH